MQSAQFQKNNQEFVCKHCGMHVLPHPTSSRDHCTICLYSLHVDLYPGDRQNTCKGLLIPIGLQTKNGKQQIVYKCKSCHATIKNIVAEDDNPEVLLELSTAVW